MFHLNEEFKKKLSPAKWRNMVSAFLNNLCGDGCIEVVKPKEPNSGNPPLIKIRWLNFCKRLAQEAFHVFRYATGSSAADTLANAQAVAATHPQSDKYVDQTVASGNTAQQIADNLISLIGTSDKAARSDHRHILETDQGSPKFRGDSITNTSVFPSDTLPSGSSYALKTDTWTPDNTNGFSIVGITRIEEDTNNGVHYLYFREFKFSKNGNPIEVSAELGAVQILA